jgi:hypothetical protein
MRKSNGKSKKEYECQRLFVGTESICWMIFIQIIDRQHGRGKSVNLSTPHLEWDHI